MFQLWAIPENIHTHPMDSIQNPEKMLGIQNLAKF